MSSALIYDGFSQRTLDIFSQPVDFELELRIYSQWGLKKLGTIRFIERSYDLSLASRARSLHLRVVSRMKRESLLTDSLWRKSQGPRLLHKAIVRCIALAALEDVIPGSLEFATGETSDAVAFAWQSETVSEEQPSGL